MQRWRRPRLLAQRFTLVQDLHDEHVHARLYPVLDDLPLLRHSAPMVQLLRDNLWAVDMAGQRDRLLYQSELLQLGP